MKINAKVLSIPPYISTSWDNVLSLHLDTPTALLVICLKNGNKISIPNLAGETLEEIFHAHSEFIEQKEKAEHSLETTLNLGSIPSNVLDSNDENFAGMMQHDPSQKDAPSLPKELLSKIKQIMQVLGIGGSLLNLPESEPHCNCPFCQIAKELHSNEEDSPTEGSSSLEEEVIDDAELKFREWDIKPLHDKLYEVSNPLIKSEHYQVFLGDPIGCTCGKNNCEHIVAVLNS